MDREKNLLENDQLFRNLFENTDEKDERLYKNDLFTPSTEEYEFSQKNSRKNQTEIIRDKILKKLSLEDYTLFPPKNDSILITDNELNKDKEDQEKLFEEEIDHLRNLHRLNYLTFSPFGISYFPNLNSIVQKNDEQTINTCNDTEEISERENKILNILDFDYNNYEINNDLLFNISMGFIDINKLKHENAVSSENFIPRSERFSSRKQIKNLQNSAPKPSVENDKKKPVENIYNQDVEFKDNLMNKLVQFVKEHEHIEFYNTTINNFYKELNGIQQLSKNKEKNKLLLKWEKIFIERQKLYKKYLLDQRDKERKKRKEAKIRKEFEKRIEEQKMFKIRKERKFTEELEKIRDQGLKNLDKNGEIQRHLSIEKFGLRRSDISPTIKSLHSVRSNSSAYSLKDKNNKIRSSKNISNSLKKDERKSFNYNIERYGYQKGNNDDYYFKLI